MNPARLIRYHPRMEPPVIETRRLVLRPFGPDDIDEVARLAGDRAIADTTKNLPHPYTVDDAKAWIATHAPRVERGEALILAVTRKTDGALLGAVGLEIATRHQTAELGYWIGVPYWNRGYATEAARALVRYGFEDLGLARIHSCHLTRNPASGRVMEKIGMVEEGLLRQHFVKWGRREDIALKAILREEFAHTVPDSDSPVF